jgi:hypothetical protein
MSPLLLHKNINTQLCDHPSSKSSIQPLHPYLGGNFIDFDLQQMLKIS